MAKGSIMVKFANSMRGILNSFLNRSFPYLCLELNLPKSLYIYFPSDAFGGFRREFDGKRVF